MTKLTGYNSGFLTLFRSFCLEPIPVALETLRLLSGQALRPAQRATGYCDGPFTTMVLSVSELRRFVRFPLQR